MQGETKISRWLVIPPQSQWLCLARTNHRVHCFTLKEPFSRRIKLGGISKKATRTMNYMASSCNLRKRGRAEMRRRKEKFLLKALRRGYKLVP